MGATGGGKPEGPPKAKRPWFPVADGLIDHLGWLTGARLAVFLVVLSRTKYQPEWEPFSLAELSRLAHLSRSTAHRALTELASLGPEIRGVDGTLIGRRKYLRYRASWKGRPGKVEVARWIRGNNVFNSSDLAFVGSHQRDESCSGLHGDSKPLPFNDIERVDTAGGTAISRERGWIPSAGRFVPSVGRSVLSVGRIKSELTSLQELTRSLDSEISEEREVSGTESPEGTARGPAAGDPDLSLGSDLGTDPEGADGGVSQGRGGSPFGVSASEGLAACRRQLEELRRQREGGER